MRIPRFQVLFPALFISILGALPFLGAQETAGNEAALPVAESLTAYLGLKPHEALPLMGTPQEMLSRRGSIPEEDNVVFYYPSHLYLFWFQNRIWQVRADLRWEGSIDGVSMGMTRPEVEELWGPPINETHPAPTWTLPDRGYPVRIRLYFNEASELVDAYVYRSDW